MAGAEARPTFRQVPQPTERQFRVTQMQIAEGEGMVWRGQKVKPRRSRFGDMANSEGRMSPSSNGASSSLR